MTDRTILAILDPTNRGDQPVVDRAAWLAQHTGASVELFACDYDGEIERGVVSTVWIQKPDAKEHLLDIHRERLETIAKPLRTAGLEVSVDVAWDFPLGPALVRKIRKRKPWLVAKDTHHHGILKRTILSNTDWHLIRECPTPLLLVKPRHISFAPKVFAAVDPMHQHDKPGHLDNAIIDQARTLADDVGGALHVVHCYNVPIEWGMPFELSKQIKKQHQEALKKFVAPLALPSERLHLAEGPTEERVPAIMEVEHADFIVMGAISRTGIQKLTIGSTAERVLDRLPCDLLITKPEWYSQSDG